MRSPKVLALYCTTRCDNRCGHCLVRDNTLPDADFDDVICNLNEFKKLGGVYVDFTGGNPLLVPWLEDSLRESNKLSLYSSLTVSGPQVVKQGYKIFPLPNLLRFSIDGGKEYHNANRGKGYFEYIRAGLKIASEVRSNRKTQLIFTVIPGPKGNINRTQFAEVLRLAREFRALVNVNPLFNDLEYSEQEKRDLLWLARQADVQMSRGKLRFIQQGGNNAKNPVCEAVKDVATISADNFLVLPCYHHITKRISLKNGLRPALWNSKRTSTMSKCGQFRFCQGCSIWCYIVPSFMSHILDRVVTWQHALSGLQPLRDPILRACGKLHPNNPYPDFKT